MSDWRDDDKALLRMGELVQLPTTAREPGAYLAHLESLWEKGLPPGSKTGWLELDKHYTVAPGHFTLVTGWPSSGKSEWLDALLMNLARQGWRLAIFSPENLPTEIHIAKFLEKFTGKPFGTGPTARMSKDEMAEAVGEINDWFHFIGPAFGSEKTTFTIEEVIGAAEFNFRSRGLWAKHENPLGLVMDPWNEFEHHRPQHCSETEYIGATLTMIRSWARANGVHVWIVAHPQKLRRLDDGKLPVPTPDTISGSQHWWNKADNCITVWRELGTERQYDEVLIHVQKVRFKHIGRQGVVPLVYDRVTGRYHNAPPSTGLQVVGQ